MHAVAGAGEGQISCLACHAGHGAGAVPGLSDGLFLWRIPSHSSRMGIGRQRPLLVAV